MVHLQYRGSVYRLIDEAMRDVGRLEHGGVDGLLFENDLRRDYTAREVSIEEADNINYVIGEVRKITTLPYGVNVLPLDYESAFGIAARTGASFVQIDTFVDIVRTDYANKFVLKIDPCAVVDFRRRSELDNIALFTNVQTKHYTTIPPNKKLETSARQAIQNGADALVVTGSSTGRKTPVSKLKRVKAVAGETPVFAGSGVNRFNIPEIWPYVDGVIVGTGLKVGGVTENPVDEDETKRFMEVVYRLRE